MFTCGTCGYLDKVGATTYCPVCKPELNEGLHPCFFLNQESGFCRLDGTKCEFKEKGNYDDCTKIEGEE